jgi:glucans biosynthesis protein
MGGIPGHARPKGVHKFTVDFEGGGLDKLTRSDGVEAVVTASRGEIDNVAAFNVVSRPRFRAQFDLHAEGPEPVNLRLYLRRDGKALTETWLFQYLPPPSAS